VLDLSRHINAYVLYQHFKYKGWPEAEMIVQPNSFFVSWDFISNYHHVSINPKQCKYLGFAFSGLMDSSDF
jgi:hypothetical protein